jgi:Uma2 family endonuclease
MLTAVDKLEHLKTMIELAKSKDAESEQVFIINNIPWQQYEKLLNFVGDNAGVRLKYLEKNLEIMSPSSVHEFHKKTIGILLECYFLTKGIRFYPLGSTTFRAEKNARGIEPDQGYCLNSPKEFPDLAIEVVVTSGGIDSLNIYKKLGVSEVWFWGKEELKVYVLQENEEYIQVNKSSLLPDLDLNLFASYITYDEPFDAVLEFRDKITKLK